MLKQENQSNYNLKSGHTLNQKNQGDRNQRNFQDTCPSIAQERESFLARDSLTKRPRLNNQKSQISSFSNQSLSSLDEANSSSSYSNNGTIFAMNSQQLNTQDYQTLMEAFKQSEKTRDIMSSYDLYIQRDINDRDLKKGTQQPRVFVDLTKKAGKSGNKKLTHNYHMLVDQELRRIGQYRQDKQTTPVLAPSQCSLTDDKTRQMFHHPTNLSNVLLQTATFRNESTEKRKPHKTPKQVATTHKTTTKSKKSITAKGHQNAIFKQNRYKLMLETINDNSKVEQQQQYQESQNNKQNESQIAKSGPPNKLNQSGNLQSKQIVMNGMNYMDKIQDMQQQFQKKFENFTEADSQEYFQLHSQRFPHTNHSMLQKGVPRHKNASSFVTQDNHGSQSKFQSESKNHLNIDMINNNSLEVIISKPTPKNLIHNFDRSRQTNTLTLENYSTMNNLTSNSGKRQQSENRPHQTMVAHNQSKIEELNKSTKKGAGSPTFKVTRDMSIEGATRRSPTQKVNQSYNSQVIAKDNKSPGQIKPYPTYLEQQNGLNRLAINTAFQNVQTPTHSNQVQKVGSPKLLHAKSTTQNELKGSGKKQDATSGRKRAQDVREISVKKSLLAHDDSNQQLQPQKTTDVNQ